MLAFSRHSIRFISILYHTTTKALHHSGLVWPNLIASLNLFDGLRSIANDKQPPASMQLCYFSHPSTSEGSTVVTKTGNKITELFLLLKAHSTALCCGAKFWFVLKFQIFITKDLTRSSN